MLRRAYSIRHSRGASANAAVREALLLGILGANVIHKERWKVSGDSAKSGRFESHFSAVWGRRSGILGAYIILTFLYLIL